MTSAGSRRRTPLCWGFVLFGLVAILLLLEAAPSASLPGHRDGVDDVGRDDDGPSSLTASGANAAGTAQVPRHRHDLGVEASRSNDPSGTREDPPTDDHWISAAPLPMPSPGVESSENAAAPSLSPAAVDDEDATTGGDAVVAGFPIARNFCTDTAAATSNRINCGGGESVAAIGSRQDSFTAAVYSAAGQPCIAPVVCQYPGNGSSNSCRAVAAEAADVRLPACAWQLPELAEAIHLAHSFAAGSTKRVIVEVGTNVKPETAWLPRETGRYTIAVEPLRSEGRHLWGQGHATVLVSAAVSARRGVTEFRVAGSGSAMVAPSKSSHDTEIVVVPTLPLSEIVERLVPTDVHGEILAIDAQGNDLDVLRSAGLVGLSRFDMVIIECENLWAAHPQRLIPSSPTCSAIAAEVEEKIAPGVFAFAGCLRNMGQYEYNCLFVRIEGAGDIAAAFRQLSSSHTPGLRWPPDPANVSGLVAARQRPQDPAAWLREHGESVATWPGGLAQLAAVMPLRRALDAAFLMCPVLLDSRKARSHCGRLLDRALLRQALFTRNACGQWRKLCSSADYRKIKGGKKRCLAAMGRDCSPLLHEYHANTTAAKSP